MKVNDAGWLSKLSLAQPFCIIENLFELVIQFDSIPNTGRRQKMFFIDNCTVQSVSDLFSLNTLSPVLVHLNRIVLFCGLAKAFYIFRESIL